MTKGHSRTGTTVFSSARRDASPYHFRYWPKKVGRGVPAEPDSGTASARARSRAGGTLVEVMVSSLLLAIIAVGSGSYLAHARAQVLHARNQRVALEALNQQLERVRAADYDDIKPTALNYGALFLRRSGTNWVHSSSDPGDTVDLNGLTFPMQTTVQYLDVDGGAASYDYVQVRVQAESRANATDPVFLETRVAP